MNIWWNDLDIYSRVLFIVGSIFTVLLLLKIVLMFVGHGDGSDLDGDGIGDYSGLSIFGLKIISIRALTAFVCIGAWTTYIFNILEFDYFYSTLIGVGSGVVMAVVVTWLMQIAGKLQTNGNLNTARILGKSGEVYLTIPANKTGTGKVTIQLEDRFLEMEAITDSIDNLKTGTRIKVNGIIGDNVLLVEKI